MPISIHIFYCLSSLHLQSCLCCVLSPDERTKRASLHLVYGCMLFVQIMESKINKLEQLVRLKDAKIQTLLAKMQAAGLS